MSKKPTNWGDDEEEGDYETKVDSKGQKLRVHTKTNAKGQKVRVTSTVKVTEVKVRVPKRVIERRNLPRFGEAKEGEANITLHSPDWIAMEHPEDQLVEDAEDNGLNTLAGFILKQQERQLERQFEGLDFDELGDDIDVEQLASKAVKGEMATSSSGAGGPSTYVPPSQRAGARPSGGSGGPGGGDSDNTLRVSNLTKAVTEDDLRELFCRYGRISRVSLPKSEKKDEKGNIYKEPKGFAYIQFSVRSDAETAMRELQGHGYDHLILKIEWAKNPENGGGGGGGGFRSGYGEKLAQDTTEKVSYASNLTGNH